MDHNDSAKLKVNILCGKIYQSTIAINTKLGRLKRKFCKENRIRNSLMKFLFDGQIIEDQDTASTIGLMDGDTIEVFKEMVGGGKPMGTNIAKDSEKILNVLDTFSASEDDVSSDENNEDFIEPEHDLKDNCQFINDESMKTGEEKQCDESVDKNVNQSEDTTKDDQTHDMKEACYQIQTEEPLLNVQTKYSDAILTHNNGGTKDSQLENLHIARNAGEELEIQESLEQARELGQVEGLLQTEVQCQNDNLSQADYYEKADQMDQVNCLLKFKDKNTCQVNVLTQVKKMVKAEEMVKAKVIVKVEDLVKTCEMVKAEEMVKAGEMLKAEEMFKAEEMVNAEGMRYKNVETTKEIISNHRKSYDDAHLGIIKPRAQEELHDEPYKDTCDQSINWLENFKEKTSGKLNKKNPLDKKILFYMQLPEPAPIEIEMLKSLIERKEQHKKWEDEKEEVFTNVPIKPFKRKRMNEEANDRILRNKLSEEKREEITENQSKFESSFESPKHQEHLLKVFGMSTPSPLIKMAKIKEEEMRRLSLATHLWAETKCGSMNMLKQTRLTEKHFKEIIAFAGPHTKYKFIKDRSALQYKNLWRNTTNSSDLYHGHPETGYETEMKLHDPSILYCPFEHCKIQIGPMRPLDIDLIMMTPKKIMCGNSTNRKLFGIDNDKLSKPIIKKDQNTEFEENFNESTLSVQEKHDLVKTNICIESGHSVKPSPTKEELKRQNQILVQEIRIMKENKSYASTKTESKKACKTLVKCRIDICGKEFETMFGLIKHNKNHHPDVNMKKINEVCKFCGKEVLYIDKHIKAVHKDALDENICEICEKTVTGNMKKHRGMCISCPTCGYKNPKKLRLLRHISICKKTNRRFPEQIAPMDLTSPMKKAVERSQENVEQTETAQSINNTETFSNESQDDDKLLVQDASIGCNNEIDKEKGQEDIKVEVIQDLLDKKRKKYPFDEENEEETYLSEFEEGDCEDYTKERRRNKDTVERKLREVDAIPNQKNEGDEDIVKQFRAFLKAPSMRGCNEVGFSQIQEVSTIGMYARAVEIDLLPAFHELFEPFDSRWLLDCTTRKSCLFEGEERCFVSPEEPIYKSTK